MAIPVHDYARVDRHVAVTRKAATRDPYSPVMILITLLAMLGVLLYAQFLLNPRNRGDLLPYTLVIIAEVILVAHALMAMWTILAGRKSPRDFAFHEAKRLMFDQQAIAAAGLTDRPQLWPIMLGNKEVDVDIFITVYGEDIEKIRATAAAAVAVKGKHRTWILDDGRSDEVRDLADELGSNYIRRLSSGGAKAGNVNHALSIAKGDFFVILDADFVPRPDFLVETVPFFINSNVAFVQTPQTYGNLVNMVSRGAGYMQAVFYKFVQPGRNTFNAAFSVGTNVIYRRAAANDIGGIYTDSKSEDVWTSLMLHERGWKSVYIPKTLAVGDAPETIEAYTKQQLRWATGGFEILLTHNPFSPKTKLTMDQRLMYTVTATHYLTGIAPGILLIVPALEVFFDLHPVNLDITWQTWLLFYAGFYVMQIVLAFYTLGAFRWEVLMLAAVSFPIYISAFLNALTKKEQRWHVTGSKAKVQSPFNFIIPQVLVFIFLVGTSIVAIWRDVLHSQLSLATAWSVTNTFILGAFMVVALKESWYNRHPRTDLVPDVVEVLVEEDEHPLTTVIVPPERAKELGVPELAIAKSTGTLEAGLEDGRADTEHSDTDTDTDTDTDNHDPAAAKRSDEK